MQHPLTQRLQRTLAAWLEQPEILWRLIREQQPAQIGLCAVLGIAVGAIISLAHELLVSLNQALFALPAQAHLSAAEDINVLRILLVPTIGGLALGAYVLAMKYLRPRDIVDPIEANAMHGGRMSLLDSIRLFFAAMISNSSGVSIGMEAGYTQLGSGFMSFVGRKLQLRREDLRVLVAAGAAAAIAAAFNAPLAGAFYGFELVLGTYMISALPQVAVAALTSALVARLFIGGDVLFSLPLTITEIPTWNYPFFVLLGIASAVVGIATMKLVTRTEQSWNRTRVPEWLRPAIGGLLCGMIALMFPQVLGSGQGAIDAHLKDHWPLLALIGLMVAKIIASAISVGSGFRGGLFSSALLIGCLFGQIAGVLASIVLPQSDGQLETFMLVGMGAVAASIVGAPVTMVLLVLEMTGNFPTVTATLLGVLIASAITRYSFGYSFATWRFHTRGIRITSAHDVGWIRDLTVGKLMQSGARTVLAETPIAQLQQQFPPGSAKRIVVVDRRDYYCGTIDIAELHGLSAEEASLVARDVANESTAYLLPEEHIQEALERFRQFKLEELPVLSARENGRVLGYLTEAYALRRYTRELEARSHAVAPVPTNS